MTITEDVVFTAIFNRVLNKYTVTFYGADGITVISSEELEYGATITLPEEPVLEGHNFVGWSGYSNVMKVEGNVNFRAMFEVIEDNTDSSSDSNSSSAPKVTVNCTSSLSGSLFALLVVSCAAMLIKRKK
ncbi:MAG: InlB B-repeat-containing protein [Clostridia bacterium]|nr:InlB B-repeat-containing protein [Clostridia bacterium]